MAISRDGSTGANTFGSGTSITVALTNSTANLMWAIVQDFSSAGGTDTCTGVTYNGVAMTRGYADLTGGINGMIWFYYLANPATGTNNIVASFNASIGTSSLAGLSYNNAKVTGIPDATKAFTSGIVTNPSTSITTVADNCWVLGRWVNSGVAVASTTPATLFGGNGPFFDSAAAITPAGAYTLSAASTGASAIWQVNAVSFAPSVATPTNSGFFAAAARR